MLQEWNALFGQADQAVRATVACTAGPAGRRQVTQRTAPVQPEMRQPHNIEPGSHRGSCTPAPGGGAHLWGAGECCAAVLGLHGGAGGRVALREARECGVQQAGVRPGQGHQALPLEAPPHLCGVRRARRVLWPWGHAGRHQQYRCKRYRQKGLRQALLVLGQVESCLPAPSPGGTEELTCPPVELPRQKATSDYSRGRDSAAGIPCAANHRLLCSPSCDTCSKCSTRNHRWPPRFAAAYKQTCNPPCSAMPRSSAGSPS